MSGLLLDTCAIIWMLNGDSIDEPGRSAMMAAADGYELYVSPVSAWELGLLTSPRRKVPLQLATSPEAFFEALLARPGVRLLPLDHVAAVKASFLPEPLHLDPGDRLLIASARERGLAIATRDRRILDYAALGHVRAVAC